MEQDTHIVIDFDSTFVSVESLEEFALLCLKDNPHKVTILEQMREITRMGMEGKIPFNESLSKRFQLFKPTHKHLDLFIKKLRAHITPSIKNNRQFFKDNTKQIYIISGGFFDYIYPVVKSYGILPDHVLANRFTYNKNGEITGYDVDNPLAQPKGKVAVVKKLKLKNLIVIGDGYTDLEIKKHGAADVFYAYTEHISRDNVVTLADAVLPNFDEFLYRIKQPRAISYPKNRMKVLLLENIHPLAVEKFKHEGYQVITSKSAMKEEELIKAIKDISILGIRSRTFITPAVLKAAQKLYAIGAFCIGTNQIDMKESLDRGIAVFNAPYSNTRSVVELVIGEIIMLYRNTVEKHTKLQSGIWDKSAAGSHEIRGKKLGIIGYGNIGSQLSVLAEALGMEVYFYDIADKLALGNAHKCESMQEVFKKCDVITIHVDGRSENRNLIGQKEFRQMKDGVLFLNIARGFIVDINALADAIKMGKVAGAGVDVFPSEPKGSDEIFQSPLQHLPNVILTPHVGGSTIEAQENIGKFVSDKLMTYINTGSTLLSVNMPSIQLPELVNGHRFIHIHKNIPGILAQINNTLAKEQINIEGQYLKTNEQIGYVITDVNKTYSNTILQKMKKISGTIKFRVLY